VLCYARSPEEGGNPYWVHTSSDDILRRLLLERGHTLAADIDTLLAGGTLTRRVDDNIVFADVDRDPDAAMSLLLMSGYLTARELGNVDGEKIADLAIPNLEIRSLFKNVISGWIKDQFGRSERIQTALRAMLSGDAETFGEILSEVVVRTLSYHDTAGDEPERVYQAFLLGLLVHLSETHEVRSDREAGYGRHDVMIAPRKAGGTGVVLELKRLRASRGETVEAALASALGQVRERRYAEEIRSRAAVVREYGIVFDGKRVWVQAGEG
jgi:hypothetical protein